MIPPSRPLEVPGYGGASLPCVLHSAGTERGVAVVFPGSGSYGNRLGGTPARPDLHYTRAALQAEGLAVFEVWWDAGSAPEPDQERWLEANAAAALTAAAEEFELALLVGRSLGTRALAQALSKNDPQIQKLPSIWLAPLLSRPQVLAALQDVRAPAFVVGGTNDAAFRPPEAEALREKGAEVVVLDGADHGLEVDDPAASARLLADVIEQLRRFVANTTGG